MLSRALISVAVLSLTACSLDKDDAKGAVDDSLPPAPTTELGKADGSSNVLPLAVESPHPYANNLDRTWTIDLAATLPPCADQARLHFSVLRTEANYDFVDVAGESFDGNHDDTWTAWFDASGGTVDVTLTTDGSITRHGFVIDRVEWSGEAPRCPPLVPCADGTVALRHPAGACACPEQNTCVPFENITVRHDTSRGRMHSGKQTDGLVASILGVGAWDQIVTTPVGTVDAAGLDAVLTEAAMTGLLFGEGYEITTVGDHINDYFTITAGDWTVAFFARQGGHTTEVAALIARFDALFACAGDDAPLACGDGYSCVDYSCQLDSACSCAEIYQPVCGLDGRTYGNPCMAGCAQMDIAHAGECGQIGDPCGGIGGGACFGDNRCRYDVSTFEAPFPDAAGSCVARTYCDAPVDCNGLPAPAVLGAWACESQACVFRAGPVWHALTGGRFETAHPYGNSTSVWKELTLPAEAQALRLLTTGTFALERNYDFLEVWSWTNGAWVRVRRYTGATGPALTDSFAGRYHYLRFVSDSSVVANGFDVSAEWR